MNTDPHPKMWTTRSPITFIPYCVHCIKGAVEKDNSKGIEEGRNNISTRLFVNLVFLSAFPHHRHHHHHNNYSQFIHMDYHLHSLTIFFRSFIISFLLPFAPNIYLHASQFHRLHSSLPARRIQRQRRGLGRGQTTSAFSDQRRAMSWEQPAPTKTSFLSSPYNAAQGRESRSGKTTGCSDAFCCPQAG